MAPCMAIHDPLILAILKTLSRTPAAAAAVEDRCWLERGTPCSSAEMGIRSAVEADNTLAVMADSCRSVVSNAPNMLKMTQVVADMQYLELAPTAVDSCCLVRNLTPETVSRSFAAEEGSRLAAACPVAADTVKLTLVAAGSCCPAQSLASEEVDRPNLTAAAEARNKG